MTKARNFYKLVTVNRKNKKNRKNSIDYKRKGAKMRESFTTGRVAELCNVTYRSVLKWIEEGKLRSYRTPGGHNRVEKEDFLSFLTKFNLPVPEVIGGDMRRKRILIVDDDKNMVESLKEILQIEDAYEIDVACDGFDAGRKLLKFRPELLILDIRMPGMDGYEVAQRIKRFSEIKDVKIIAVSAYFEEEGKNRILSMGADVCIDKPFDPAALLKKIRDLLSV